MAVRIVNKTFELVAKDIKLTVKSEKMPHEISNYFLYQQI
jgi:hypothetical protein